MSQASTVDTTFIVVTNHAPSLSLQNLSRDTTDEQSQNNHAGSPETTEERSQEESNTETVRAPSPQPQPQDEMSPRERLGIITTRPKCPQYAVNVVRLQSFEGWPPDHHLNPADLVKAGFFYAGYGDCARCFYCAGGLRNWDDGDDVWVEHARYYPKCDFIRRSVGQPFIDVVQDKNRETDTITFADVVIEMRARGLGSSIPTHIMDTSTLLKKDPAVLAAIDHGFQRSDVLLAATELKESGRHFDALTICDVLEARNAKRTVTRRSDLGDTRTTKRDAEREAELKEENERFRQQTQCKICMDNEISTIFLPCGHFVSCSDCSFALTYCPVCREKINGVVKGYLCRRQTRTCMGQKHSIKA